MLVESWPVFLMPPSVVHQLISQQSSQQYRIIRVARTIGKTSLVK